MIKIVPFSALPTLSSVLDLLHHLLNRKTSRVRILKFSEDGGSPSREVVSGLRVYTAIFKHYGSCKYLYIFTKAPRLSS